MARYTTVELPSFEGPAALPKAMETVLGQRELIGGAVMRDFFRPDAAEVQARRPYASDFVTDTAGYEAALTATREWWSEHGYEGTYVEGLLASAAHKAINGYAAATESGFVRPVITAVASLAGEQRIYVVPGVDRRSGGEEIVEAEQNKADGIRGWIQRVRTEASYRRVYDFSSRLTPGDVALVMGHPSPAIHGLRASVDSDYATMSFRYGENMYT